MKIKIGNAKYSKPPTTIPINTIGRSKTVSNIFDIPQAVFIPNINNFPNTPNIHIINNNSNISFFSFSYPVRFLLKHTIFHFIDISRFFASFICIFDLFFKPILSAKFLLLSIFSTIRLK